LICHEEMFEPVAFKSVVMEIRTALLF
jgi:hypothetical protein